MINLSRRRRLIAWIAVFAVLTGALLSSLGQALMRSADPQRWAEICTAEGMIRLELPAGQGASNDDEGAATAERCPLCLPFAGQAVLAVGPVAPPPVYAVDRICQTQQPEPVSRSAIWLAAYGRGPPSLI